MIRHQGCHLDCNSHLGGRQSHRRLASLTVCPQTTAALNCHVLHFDCMQLGAVDVQNIQGIPSAETAVCDGSADVVVDVGIDVGVDCFGETVYIYVALAHPQACYQKQIPELAVAGTC